MKNIEDKIPDITNLATKTTLNAQINEVTGEIPCITNLTTAATLNAKINQVKSKILSITNLASTTAFTAVENIIPNVSNLVKKKTGYKTKISKIGKKITDHNHDKCITSAEFNTLAAETFAAKFAQANLASNEIPIENDIAALVKNTDFDDKQINLSKKVTSNKLKHLLVENKF